MKDENLTVGKAFCKNSGTTDITPEEIQEIYDHTYLDYLSDSYFIPERLRDVVRILVARYPDRITNDAIKPYRDIIESFMNN